MTATFTKSIVIGLAALFMTAAAPAALPAQNLKVGLVNFKYCVENSKLGKQEQSNFESLKKQMDEVLEEKEKALSEISGKLNDPDYLDSLSQEAEAELKHKYRSMTQEMAQHQQQFYQMLNQANFKIVQKLNEIVGEASKEVAKKKNLDLIINEEGTFYYSQALDISKDVVKEMDLKAEKK